MRFDTTNKEDRTAFAVRSFLLKNFISATKKSVDKCPCTDYNDNNNQTRQTSEEEEYPARRTCSESRTVQAGWGAAEGMDFRGRSERLFSQVAADGDPPVIHRARVMAREASGRLGVNLGGIAGVQLLSHVG